MKELLKTLLTSKKFLATLVSLCVWVLGRFGLDVDAERLLPVVAIIGAYVVGQGIADSGKEAAKVQAKAGSVAGPVTDEIASE